jgi:glycosyltransferase involved in cell wall biosynthesis
MPQQAKKTLKPKLNYRLQDEFMKDHISVCICTFKRNEMLGRLLRKLKCQETEGTFDFSVVVVDNDYLGSAEKTVTNLRHELDLDIKYAIEKEQTIPAARNHAIKLAKGNYIAIIDDDEFPPSQWLITMYRALQTFDVDGALGPVFPWFERTPPRWLIESKICERPVYRTGKLLEWNQTMTGNVLLKRKVFDEHNLIFDLRFKTSGSDRDFFRRAMNLGYRFAFVEEAPVYENVPPERWTKKYYLIRALVQGYNSYRMLGGIRGNFHHLLLSLKSLLAVLAYCACLPFCYLLGTPIVVKCLEKGAHHFSFLMAMLGIELVKKRDF